MATTASALPATAPAEHPANDTPAAPDRAAVNRENAQHSTGPRTEDGKSRVRLNACKHGLYSKIIVLPGEDQAHFDALGKAYLEQYQPRNSSEIELVDRLHTTQWRLSRAVALELNLHAMGALEQMEHIDARFGELDPAARSALAQASAFVANCRLFDQLNRHEGRLQRLYDRTQKALDRILADRLAGDEPAAQPPVARATPPVNKTTPAARGFVSPVSTANMPQFTGPLADIKRKQWIRRQETLRSGASPTR